MMSENSREIVFNSFKQYQEYYSKKVDAGQKDKYYEIGLASVQMVIAKDYNNNLLPIDEQR